MVDLVTDAGTGTLCACGHGSDLHTLEEIELFGDEGENSIRWRFSCAGFWIPRNLTSLTAYTACTCTNMRLTGRDSS